MIKHIRIKLCPAELLSTQGYVQYPNQKPEHHTLACRLDALRNPWNTQQIFPSQPQPFTVGELLDYDKPSSEANIAFHYLSRPDFPCDYLFYTTRVGITHPVHSVQTSRTSAFNNCSGLFIRYDVLNSQAARYDLADKLAKYEGDIINSEEYQEINAQLTQLIDHEYQPDATRQSGFFKSYLLYYISTEELLEYSDSAVYLENLDLMLNLRRTNHQVKDLFPHPYSVTGSIIYKKRDIETIPTFLDYDGEGRHSTKIMLIDKSKTFHNGIYFLRLGKVVKLMPTTSKSGLVDGVYEVSYIDDVEQETIYTGFKDLFIKQPVTGIQKFYQTKEQALSMNDPNIVSAQLKYQKEQAALEAEKVRIEAELKKREEQQLLAEQARAVAEQQKLEMRRKNERLKEEQQMQALREQNYRNKVDSLRETNNVLKAVTTVIGLIGTVVSLFVAFKKVKLA